MTSNPNRRSFAATLIGVATLAALPARRIVAGTTPTGIVHEVKIRDFAFEPARLEVAVGDEVRWTNMDLAPHTATAEDESWDTGDIAQGESASIIANQSTAGKYGCLYHPHMKAELSVLSI